MKKRNRGQHLYMFLGMIPLFLLLMVFVVDFGRFMLLSATVQAQANTSALAGADAVNLTSSAPGNFVLDPAFAIYRVNTNMKAWYQNRQPYESWMNIRVLNIQVSGNQIKVTLQGTCTSILGMRWGITGYDVIETSYAKAAAGVSAEGQ